MLSVRRSTLAALVAAACLVAVVARAKDFGEQRTSDGASFDLSIRDVTAWQTGATPMFRDVLVQCTIENKGPAQARGPALLVISRPGDGGDPKVLKEVPLPMPLSAGETLVYHAEGWAWFATPVPYRCEIRYEGANRDADPSDDYGVFTYPRL